MYAEEEKMLRHSNKKGDRVAVPRSGGYVLILLYINLKKTKQVCFLLVAILIGKDIAKASRLRAEEKEEVLRRPNKKGGPRGGPPQRRLCFNSIIHQLEKKLNKFAFY